MGKIYAGVSNTAREVKAIYAGVNGVAKEIKKVYVGVNGVAKLIWEKSGGGAILPDAYQQVEWIGTTEVSNNSPYIDTGVQVSVTSGGNKMRVTMTMEWNSLVSNARIFGARNGSTRFSFGYFNNGWGFGYGGSYTNNGAAVIEQKYDLDMSFITGNHKLKVDGNDKVSATWSGNVNIAKNCYLFRHNYNSAWFPCNAKIYACKIYVNDELVRDFYPCYRKSDNVAGMYDMKGTGFYPNAGSTGTFATGNNYIGPL